MKFEKIEEEIWSLTDVLSHSEYESLGDEFHNPQVEFKI